VSAAREWCSRLQDVYGSTVSSGLIDHTPHFATLDLVDAAVLDGYILSVRIAIPVRDFNTLEIRTKSQKQNY